MRAFLNIPKPKYVFQGWDCNRFRGFWPCWSYIASQHHHQSQHCHQTVNLQQAEYSHWMEW